MDVFLERVAAEFPRDFISTDGEDKASYGRDWTKVFTPAPALIAFPRTTDEVSRFLQLCHLHRVAVVPSGGRTGLAGGAVAKNGEVVLSLQRMAHLGPVDTLGHTVRVQAGAVTEAVHKHCEDAGLTWPVDFASKGSSQVGGNIATNAGGVKVIHYGLVRNWVLGLQVVLADGRVLELNGALEKNNTGIDLRQLFIGSEGTLGVITEATLKLARVPKQLHVYLFAVDSLAKVLEVFRYVRRHGSRIMAYEFFTDRCMQRLSRHRQLKPPFASSHYVLLELDHVDDALVQALFDEALVDDGVTAQSSQQAAELWALREGISESLSATGLPHKNDVALPISRLEVFTADLEAAIAQQYPDWEICLFGHIGDGNLHINIMKPDALDKATFLARTHDVDHVIFKLVQKHGGSISAEHGIGLLKKDFLPYSRTPEEIALMRQLKQVFDPHRILNPSKLFDG